MNSKSVRMFEQSVFLGKNEQSVHETFDTMKQSRCIERLWEKDAALWKEDAAHRKIIENSLGWLRVPEMMLTQVESLKIFTDRIRTEGFEYVMLLGMGGSSLCPEVFRRTFRRISGYPELLVLDSTDPVTVRNLEKAVDVGKTLFIVASKSGTTTEPHMFYQYFFDRVSRVKQEEAGSNFVAITDSGSLLEKIAEEKKFRKVFLNPADIGGRYSALSFFGMVPAALMGLEISELLKRSIEIAENCKRSEIDQNPGAHLGAVLGALAKHGRDKVTFVIPPPIDSLSLWIEQLIAESTGKEGRGILPVAGEPLGTPDVYGNDRVFVYVRTQDSLGEEVEKKLTGLKKAGHPVIQQIVADPLSLGAEFFIWEIATAIASSLIGIDAFDQPNVQESKDNTKALLEIYLKTGKLPEQDILWKANGLRIYCDSETKAALSAGAQSFKNCIQAHLARLKPRDYLALTAYIPETVENDDLLNQIRTVVRNKHKVATTVGYGPRFLHSTGQLHKGGADNGVFIQITAEDREYLPIPGEKQTFGILKQAQALGDFQSLSNRHRRAIRLHLGNDIEAGLKALLEAVHS